MKGNEELFGPGIVYQGCFNDEPRAFRGQTGAQDDIIPTQDIFTGLTEYYPQNKLTEYLVDLRQYRPRCVQTFFDDLRAAFGGKALLKHLSQLPVEGAEDSAATAAHRAEALVWLWRIVDEIYRFRNGHWQFVQQYIMANTRYPVQKLAYTPTQMHSPIHTDLNICGYSLLPVPFSYPLSFCSCASACVAGWLTG